MIAALSKPVAQTLEPSSLGDSARQEAFAQQMEAEFVTGSGIAPALFEQTTQMVADTEYGAGGEVDYPIHKALNWKLSRFGHQARATFYALLLLNEDGSIWQAKLSKPLLDTKQQKPRKYEAPVGNGSQVFQPVVPIEIRQRIGQRYGVTVPLEGSFWDWLAKHPEIPMIPTEGAKKALALLSQGYVPLCLYGVNSGYRRLPGETRVLISGVERFAQDNREFVLAFDQDAAAATRKRVHVALFRFGGLLSATGCPVKIAQWQPEQGKGVDDLIVQSGAIAWETAYTDALPFSAWKLWQGLESRLTYKATLTCDTADLSSLEGSPLPLSQLPDQGLIAIESAKGTGKTKFIGQLVTGRETVLALGHRIALMRNLASRLGLDYKGDLDKVHGEFITAEGYTTRIGLCVDSLASIEPSKFAGADLVIDEVVQVVKHLVSSSTCAKEGKRPLLLARFRELVRNAGRVIVADADLDNATLNYLKDLRGDEQPVFLIRNQYQPQGYPVRFIEAPDRTAIVNELLQAVKALEPRKMLFVTTDSKGISKVLFRLLAQEAPEKRVLLINSETSGGDLEREFMQAPDTVLAQHAYDVILCSPSVATGVSIEAQGVVAAVYGIFTGASSHDADMAQAMGRVREPVPRILWCAKQGSNFSPVSRTVNSRELQDHLYQKTTTTLSLIRSSLREDWVDPFQSYDWQNNPHLQIYCRLSAEQNRSMYSLRDALVLRLRFEGHQVSVETQAPDTTLKRLLTIARQEQLEIDAEQLVRADDLSYLEVMAFEQREGVSPETAIAISKFYLKDFYAWDSLTPEQVLWDQEGRRRGELLNLEAQLFPAVAMDRTVKALEKQAAWNQGCCPWDVSGAELRRRLRAQIGLDELLGKMRSGWAWTKYDLAPYAQKARALIPQIKVALHFTISDGMSDTQIIHQLLSQLGIKVAHFRWSRSVAGHEGEKLKVHTLDQAHWASLWEILQRRLERRERIQQQKLETNAETGSSPQLEEKNQWGDPLQKWFTTESLADVQATLELAISDSALMDFIRETVPIQVLEHLGFSV